MIGMREGIMPIVSGMDIPFPFVPPVDGNSVSEQVFFYRETPQTEKVKWGQFRHCPQSIERVVRSLGDGIEKSSTVACSIRPAKALPVSDMTSETLPCAENECPRAEKPDRAEAAGTKGSDAVGMKGFDKPIVKGVEPSRAQTVQTSQGVAAESPRAEPLKQSSAQGLKIPVVETLKKAEAVAAESPRAEPSKQSSVQELKIPIVETLKKAEVSDSEDIASQKSQGVNDRAGEGAGVHVCDKSPVQESARADIQVADVVGVRMSQNIYVQTPERVILSRLVDTVVETMAVSPALSSGGDGELRIQLKSDILDGSSIRMEVRDGEFKIVVIPASRAAEEILLKSQEAFQNQLAERVTAWRINVGVAAFDPRHGGRSKLEEES